MFSTALVGQRAPAPHGAPDLGVDALTEVVDNLDAVFEGEVLNVVIFVIGRVRIVRDADHGGMDTGAHALHLTDREEAVGGDLFFTNTQVVAQAVQDFIGSADHAGGGDANLQMVLANGAVVVHAIERGDLEDALLGNTANLRNLKHGWEGDPSTVLPLGQMEEGHDGGLLLGFGVLG